MKCTGLWAHTLSSMETVYIDSKVIHKKCAKCGYLMVLPRSNRNVLFVNTLVQQKKKLAADDTKKELLQPMNKDGSINDEFTEAFGYNPYDDRTKEVTPSFQGGLA